MAAIIRRHRFTILIIICLILLSLFSWYYRRKEKLILNNTSNLNVKENYNEEIQMLDSNKKHFSEITKISDDVFLKKLQFTTGRQNFQKNSFVPLKNKKERTTFQAEELKHFLPRQREKDELTTTGMMKFGEKLALNINKEQALTIPAIRPPDKKNLHGKESFFGVPHIEKQVTLTNAVYPEEDFPAPDQGNEWVKDRRTRSLPRNVTRNLEILRIDQHINEKQNTSPKMANKTSLTKNPTSLIDTPGCKIPNLNPWDPTVKHLIELQDPYVCPGLPMFLKTHQGGSITLNKTILKNYYNATPEDLLCNYQPIIRLQEEWSNREISFTLGDFIKLVFDIPLNEDFVRVKCNLKGKDYEHYLPLVPLKKNVEDERNSIIPPNPALNVILIGIDSVSKLNFMRHYPRTNAFLNEKLNTFEMNGYTKVGDNTFPNLVPMLTGQFVEHWWNETVKDTMFFDNVSFIWKEYAKRGYRTFYAEDNPFSGTFNYIKRGFYNPPTDYYFRPLALALEMWKSVLKPKQYCLNSQLEWDVIYNYLRDFAHTMGTRPYFGFAMVSTITHDSLNNAGWTDEPTMHLLEGLLEAGALNNTLLVLFSDHGLRFGKIRHTYVGKFEERLPLMYIHVPKWFLEQYPEIAKNLKTNQDRLMTLFDIHATMVHMLDLNKTHEERSMISLGTSLFEEITPNRTCSDAFIQTHFCPCQTFDIVALNSSEVKNASQAIVDVINTKLEPHGGICEVLQVGRIMDARVGKASAIMLQYLRTENEVINKTILVGDNVAPQNDYMITLVTKPGEAVFEGTVRHNTEDNSYRVQGISRISMYGNTSWCIDSQKMKIFCYCKIQHKLT